eukprot:3839635-Rhodomonas_salina.1
MEKLRYSSKLKLYAVTARYPLCSSGSFIIRSSLKQAPSLSLLPFNRRFSRLILQSRSKEPQEPQHLLLTSWLLCWKGQMYSLCDRKVLRVVFVPCGMSALLRVACLLLLVPGSCARKTLAVSMPSSHGKNFKTRTWVPCLMTDAGVKSVSRGIRGGGQPQVDNGCSRTESGDESDGEMPGIAKEVKGDDGATAAPECSVKDIVLTQRNLNAVKLALDALSKTNSTMVVAPTGSGKTLIISSVIFTYLERIGFKGKVLVLAHRTYLLDQLEKRFHTMYPNVSTGQFRSDVQEWEAGVIFAMVPTLQREHHLQSMPTFDLVVVDECHHTPANSWARIIEHVWALNATCRLFGTTATPIR